MNAKQLIAAVAMVAATGAVFAQSQDYAAPDAHFVPAKTRAEVTADVHHAYADGTLARRDGADSVIVAGATARSRADVRAEAVQSVRNQRVDVNNTYFGG